MPNDTYDVHPIGHVDSPLRTKAEAPRQGDEGAPPATLVLNADLADAARDLREGEDIIVLTWFDRADRNELVTYPRGDTSRPPTGVFSTRSPDRPNPIGLHRVRIERIDGDRIDVADLEALDGTPIVDIKPVLGDVAER